ncbi:MAG: tRNA (adenosine(37)-N6)-threonylcarbamoyltransferase complex ATPase subunit type 1 TsaE [Bacillaceae bacterium]
MSTYFVYTSSQTETMEMAKKLAVKLEPGTVILLEGDLGAGKTTFTKGLAEGLGVKRVVNSPTFNIIKEYKGNLPLYHMDVYRLADSDDDLGFDEYFYGDGVTVVEWAHLIEDYLPDTYLKISIYHESDTNRKFKIEAIGEKYEQLCKEIF